MLCDIANSEDRERYQKQLEQTIEIIARQNTLLPDSKIKGVLLEKLNRLQNYLENQILKYDKIEKS